MKKFVLFMLCALLVFVPAVMAQDGELLWELDTTFTVTDLQFTFDLPSTWFFDATTGIAFAENQEDLAAMIDDDEETLPEGYTMRLSVIPLEDLGLEEDATLEDMADAILSSGGIEVVETFELPVMVYHSISVSGVNENGRAGVATLWEQDDHLVIFSFGTAEDELSSDAAFTWGNVLGTVTSLIPEDFEVEETILEDFGIGLLTPVDWEMSATEIGVNFVSEEGAVIGFNTQALSEIGLEDDASIEEIQEYITTLTDSMVEEGGYEKTNEGEFVVFEQPGFGIRLVAPETGEIQYTIVTTGSDGFGISYQLTAPDEETFAALRPVFFYMLQSITPLEEE